MNEYFFKYNKEGDQIERKTISHELNQTHAVTFIKNYENGQLVQEASSELPFVTNHIYNTKGERIQSYTYLGVDTAISEKRIFFYTYAINGKLKSARETYAASSNSVPFRIGYIDYIYGENKNITSILREGKPDYTFSLLR